MSTKEPRPALETTGLGKAYGKIWALRACSLAVEPGTITALVGPNGAGKTTLLQLAVGLLRPTAGSVSVFGRQPASSVAALASVAYLAQDHPLYGGLSVADLLRLGRCMNPSWDDPFARQYLSALGIPLRHKANELSGGQQAQVALTLALARRPRLLVLDEPVASLDPLARHEFMSAVLADAVDRGTTVILSSHVVSELGRACDHLVVLAQGRVQVQGPIDALLDRHRVLLGTTASTPPAGLRQVLASATHERQTTLVVELGSEPVADPRWDSRPVGLEELVLTYLRDPDAGTYAGDGAMLRGVR
ncbi:ABC transporter ATP-binding protein [Monashia sp. NPDC004114]